MWIIKFLKFIYEWRSVFKLFIRKPTAQIETFEQIAVKTYNEYMTKNNGLKVEIDLTLCKAAQYHSEWMKLNKKLSHIGAFGKSCHQRCLMAGFKGMYVAEQIFVLKGKNVKAAIEFFMNTIAAKDDIKDRFRYFGIGTSEGYWCIILGR